MPGPQSSLIPLLDSLTSFNHPQQNICSLNITLNILAVQRTTCKKKNTIENKHTIAKRTCWDYWNDWLILVCYVCSWLVIEATRHHHAWYHHFRGPVHRCVPSPWWGARPLGSLQVLPPKLWPTSSQRIWWVGWIEVKKKLRKVEKLKDFKVQNYSKMI